MLLRKIRTRWNRLLKDRSGQSTTEYILILAIVVMIASKLKTSLMKTSDNIMQNFDSKTEDFFK